ncbi:excinuclease ABC subunit UvrC [Candidatus Parcubacteria bacterium]|nr:MAG: excinuclease ABC subunit UvrC [Candidatus Parcubacteria bacterium]
MSNNTLQEKIKKLPNKPGCYLFKSQAGEIIYIGKAKNLKKRVSFYFVKTHPDLKTPRLVGEIADVDYFISQDEYQALLTEAELIKKHQPKYNLELKAGEKYAYIMITDEKFPRILTARDQTKKGRYLGPFASGQTRRELIYLCNTIFKLRVCKKLPKTACLLYHINLCTAPCINKISEDDYNENIKKAELLIRGKDEELIGQLEKEMKSYSEKFQYEIAKTKRDQINALRFISEKQKITLRKKYDQDVINFVETPDEFIFQLFNVNKGIISGRKEFRFDKRSSAEDNRLNEFIKRYYISEDIPEEIIISKKIEDQELLERFFSEIKKSAVSFSVPQKGGKLQLLELVKENICAGLKQVDSALFDLQNKLNLPSLPRVIEAFDISNLGPKYVVGSMVNFSDGIPDKNNYRRFKIKTFAGQSDFAGIKEIVFRRYYKLKIENSKLPDLLVIDGGKPQLTAALEALKELGLQIPTIAIAKKLEEIYTTNSMYPLQLDKKSDALKLILKIRDEAHRFALKYHRLLRSKKFR